MSEARKLSNLPAVFVSYSRKDNGFVDWLTRELEDAEVRVWRDTADLRVGDPLVARIATAITNVDFVIAVISSHSVKSSWVLNELQLAMTSEIQSERVKVLPLRIDDSPLPDFLCHKKYIKFDRGTHCQVNLGLLLESVRSHSDLRGLSSHIPVAVQPEDWIVHSVLQMGLAPDLADELASRVHAQSDAFGEPGFNALRADFILAKTLGEMTDREALEFALGHLG